MDFPLIRKATAVWRGGGSSADGDLSSSSSVLGNPPYSIRVRFKSQQETNTEELLAAACAGCFALALALQLQAAGPNTEAVVNSIPDPLAHTDPLIRQFECWARGRLVEGFSLDQAAQALATSKRTLARRMQSVLGKSPLAFFQDLRIERAVHLLRTSGASVDQIAAQVGYAAGVTLRALLRRRLGRGVREIRRCQIRR